MKIGRSDPSDFGGQGKRTASTITSIEDSLVLDEARAWQRLQPHLGGANTGVRRKSRGHGWTAIAGAVGIVLGWLGWQCVDPSNATQGFVPAVQQQATSTTALSSIRLATGRSQLPDGSEVDLKDGAEGTYRSDGQGASVEFDRGRLDVGVARQPEDRRFVVKANGYEFRAVATRFSVTVNEKRVGLDVMEGRVEIRDATHALGLIDAGGHWSSAGEPLAKLSTDDRRGRPAEQMVDQHTSASARSPVPESTLRPGPLAQAAAPNDPASCRDLLRIGNAKKAEQCYAEIAAGGGLSAELALYEVARLRRDVLSIPSGALLALDEYEARFASGALAPEVRMARIDLLARLGRVDEALRTSGQLLSTASGRAHAVELRLLRGNLLRDRLDDCAAAEAEYRLIEFDPGPRGAEAQLALAGCLERLGQSSLAVQTYRSYLSRTKPKHAERARQRLMNLEP